MATMEANAEQRRLTEAAAGTPWRKWGPYLSERQWGTVREDYSPNGDAWNYFTHDQARSRAYRWGQDELAGFSDETQRLCSGLVLWNGEDPIIKERLFGLVDSEGNHGEDVKEYYFYLDSTPTHSYMKWLYKYPQRAHPYDDIVAANRRRSKRELEYELLDTGVFAEDRYFGVSVEYAKASRLTRIFLLDENGRRAVFGDSEKFQTDPHWRGNVLFYEYFHGDNGAGVGASHQTGWTGLVATLIQLFGSIDAEQFLKGGKKGAFARQ